MIWRCLFFSTASLSTALVSSFSDSSVKRFDPDLETQPGLWSSLSTDTSFLDNTGFSPEVEDSSDLFSPLPGSITADSANGDFLAFDDLEGSSTLASDDSSCGSQDSSSALPNDDAEIALDLFSLNGLNARGFLDDVDKLNEFIDSPNGRSCAVSNEKRPNTRPRTYRTKNFVPEDELDTRLPIDEFGKCPVLQPEYKEAVCCTGGMYGPYVLKCAPGIHTTQPSHPSF